ncbi:hypothetical protein IF650_18380 [Cellulosimicrobium terreum]|nr:hypothetical protein [Cellulosimicrobium terreum]
MTLRALVLPGSPLLVPGVAGRATVLRDTREAVVATLRELVADAEPGTVVVVAPGPHDARGPARASLAAVGVLDTWVEGAWGRAATLPGVPRVAGPAASVALMALAGAGWTGPVETVELGACPGTDGTHTALGEELCRRGARLVVVEDPRSSGPAVLVEGFVDPARDVVQDVSAERDGDLTCAVRSIRRRTAHAGTPAPGR